MWQIAVLGRAAPQHAIYFVPHLRVDVWASGQQVPGSGERGGGCLMAGPEQRQGFIADLRIAHGASVIIARPEQDREEVVAFYAALTPLVDHLLNARAEERERMPGPTMARQRPAQGNRDEVGEHVVDVLDGDRHSRAERIGLRKHVGVEEHLADDAHRYKPHTVYRARRLPLAVWPCACGALCSASIVVQPCDCWPCGSGSPIVCFTEENQRVNQQDSGRGHACTTAVGADGGEGRSVAGCVTGCAGGGGPRAGAAYQRGHLPRLLLWQRVLGDAGRRGPGGRVEQAARCGVRSGSG